MLSLSLRLRLCIYPGSGFPAPVPGGEAEARYAEFGAAQRNGDSWAQARCALSCLRSSSVWLSSSICKGKGKATFPSLPSIIHDLRLAVLFLTLLAHHQKGLVLLLQPLSSQLPHRAWSCTDYKTPFIVHRMRTTGVTSLKRCTAHPCAETFRYPLELPD